MITSITIVFVSGIAIIIFLVGVIIHLKRKLRSKQWDLICARSTIRLEHSRLDLMNTRLKKLIAMGNANKDVLPGCDDRICLKDDCPDNEDDACTRLPRDCNVCLVRVLRKEEG